MKKFSKWMNETFLHGAEYREDYTTDEMMFAYLSGGKAMKDEIKDRLKKRKEGKNG